MPIIHIGSPQDELCEFVSSWILMPIIHIGSPQDELCEFVSSWILMPHHPHRVTSR